MASTYVQGAATGIGVSTSEESSNRIPIDMSSDITRKVSDLAPFTILTQRIPHIAAKSIKHEWMEREDEEITVTATAAAAAAAGTLYFADPQYKKLVANDVLYLPRTGNYWYVSATPTGTSVTVGSWPSGSNSAVLAGDVFIRMGTVLDEWSTTPDMFSSQPAAKYNYPEMKRTAFGVSGRLQACELIGPTEMQYLDEDKFRNHMKQMETMNLFGTRAKSGDKTSTGGIKWFMDQSGSGAAQTDMTGKPLTMTELDAFLKDAFYYNSPGNGGQKLGLCGWYVLQLIREFAQEKVILSQEAQKLGMVIHQYETPWGILNLIEHKIFRDLGLHGELWVIDMESIQVFGLPGRPTRPVLNTGKTGQGIQAEGVDGTVYEYWSECGLELRHSERFGRLYNIARPL